MSNDVQVLIYRGDTGEIVRRVSAPPSMVEIQCGEGEGWRLGVADDCTHYIDPVDPSQILERPAMPASLDKSAIRANGLEIATITAPEGAAVTVRGPLTGEEIMDADGIAFTTNLPGRYSIRAELFPYLPWEAEIVADEAA